MMILDLGILEGMQTFGFIQGSIRSIASRKYFRIRVVQVSELSTIVDVRLLHGLAVHRCTCNTDLINCLTCLSDCLPAC